MKKLAQKPAASFDETVPSTDLGMQTAESQGMAQPKKNAVVDPNSDQYAAIPAEQGQEQQQGLPQTAVPPEMVAAAQAFLGPEVMQAAMSGDPAAADLVARAAAQFGTAFMNMSAQPAPGAAGMDPNADPAMQGQSAMPGQPAPVGITSPEEDIAAELVPAVPAAQPQVPGQAPVQPGAQAQAAPQQGQEPGQVAGSQPSNENSSGQDVAAEQSTEGQPPAQAGSVPQTVDIQDVVKLINLVKAGKI